MAIAAGADWGSACIARYSVGMRARKAVWQYTVRGVPREVDAALRKKAKRLGCSLNQLLLEELTQASVGTARKAEFGDLVGKWKPDPAFDEVIASQRKVDPEKWR